jgi:ribosomal protein S18 acetylase RimI-like enzyme
METGGTRIRPATEHDVEALGRLGALLMRAHYAFDPRRFMNPGDRPEEGYGWFLGTQLHEPDGIVLVAEREGRVVGYVWASIEPLSWKELRDAAGFIQDVVVDEGERKTGVATVLVKAAVEWLREHGAPRVMLWSAQPNEQAQRLFERLGFRRTMVEMTREF